MKYKTMIRTIKREIKFSNNEYDKMVKKYLFSNMWYRRTIYNKGIEYIHKLEEYNEICPQCDEEYFNAYTWDTYFYNNYEAKDKELYDEYQTKVTGIRSMVATDLRVSNDKVWIARKKGIPAKSRYCKFTRNNQGFGVYNKYMDDNKTKRRLSIDKDGLHLVFHCYGRRSKAFRINLTLKESVYSDTKYYFTELNVTEVHFKYRAGKFFIILPTQVYIGKYKSKKRQHLVGIDEGERNSVALCNGEYTSMIDIVDDGTKKKYRALEKRINSLKSHIDKKVYGSNNYCKASLRLSQLHIRQYNIIFDRRKKIAHYISKNFNNLIVDEFNVPIIRKDSEEFTTKVRKTINKKMNMNAMGYFKEDLKIACESFNTNYYKALPLTTRTCSMCGHVNDALPLKKKYLTCSNCNRKIHRDINASINCYNQHSEFDI